MILMTHFCALHAQVYTLMKLDSYSRFLKSPLFRQCMVCEMEGRPLPLESPHVCISRARVREVFKTL